MTDPRRYWPAILDGHVEMMDRLVTAYGDQRRRYHDLRHLTEVFERLELLLQAEPQGVERDAVLLAAWFHDAVYDTSPAEDGDNEERSAMLAERELATAQLPPLLVAEVARLVRLTASHDAADPADPGGRVLCDADLGILAVDEHRYRDYARRVREEYAAVADDEFRAGRARVLTRLLDRPTLFATAYAGEHWEAQGRRNVERELTELKANRSSHQRGLA